VLLHLLDVVLREHRRRVPHGLRSIGRRLDATPPFFLSLASRARRAVIGLGNKVIARSIYLGIGGGIRIGVAWEETDERRGKRSLYRPCRWWSRQDRQRRPDATAHLRATVVPKGTSARPRLLISTGADLHRIGSGGPAGPLESGGDPVVVRQSGWAVPSRPSRNEPVALWSSLFFERDSNLRKFIGSTKHYTNNKNYIEILNHLTTTTVVRASRRRAAIVAHLPESM
jgi:hypothetical protein